MNSLRNASLAAALLFNAASSTAQSDAKPAPAAAPAKPPAAAAATAPSIYNLNLIEFKEMVLDAKGPVIVDFWAPWCKPCGPMKTELEKVALARPDIKFVMLNEDEVASVYDYLVERKHMDIALSDPFMPSFQYSNSLPELLYFKDGKLMAINEALRVVNDGKTATYFNNGHLPT